MAFAVLGSNLHDFFSNIDGLHEQIKATGWYDDQMLPSFRCEFDNSRSNLGNTSKEQQCHCSNINIHYYTNRRHILYFVSGTLQATASTLFNLRIKVRVSPNPDPNSPHQMFFITPSDTSSTATNAQIHNLSANIGSVSSNPAHSRLSVRTFCDSFPFHVIFDRMMTVRQLGSALLKMAKPCLCTSTPDRLQLDFLFNVVQPSVKMSFSAFLSRLNAAFVLRTKGVLCAAISTFDYKQVCVPSLSILLNMKYGK